ncbi:DUF421 domain-containing protein [Paenibacillus sediminis]|uniref:Uncharacterized membrane protein YcaP (DUF421 family) n=1 Tax=Paenibacillus sediminis TaxID=664909 RepID=A0ABS4H076_9BACL|nr:DUF421 domain-containing protein [Paenibacillus sediminis]MBP1935924.1 uncharacterized membrane protein YcaP (DUF421 family) [Paenibacillus sediminis]
MEFMNSQQSLTVLQWILRAVISFFFLLFAAKIMGQRSISQLRLLDFIMALMLGNIIAHPLSDERLSLTNSMITMSALVILYIVSVFASLKWNRIRYFLDPSPFPLIKNGRIIYENLHKARISIDFLLSQLRKERIEEVHKVALALWEPDGTISIFLDPKYGAVTAKMMHLKTQPFDLPTTIIKEGTIDHDNLHQTGKDEEWLKNKLKMTYHTDIQDILLATIDHNDNLKIVWYK